MSKITSIVKPLNIPRVIGFAFQDYRADEATKARSAECTTCGKTVKEKAGTTSNFLRHLRKHHQQLFKEYEAIKQSGAALSSEKVASRNSEKCPTPISTPKTYSPSAKIAAKSEFMMKNSTQSHKKDEILESIVDLVIDQKLSAAMVESEKFNSLIVKLNPKFKPISLAATNAAIDRRYHKILDDMRKRLSDAYSVNVTVNVWSDGEKRSFIAITVHFLEDLTDGMRLTSMLLSCQRAFGSNSMFELPSMFNKSLDEMGILRKLNYAIVPDMETMRIAHSLAFLPVDNPVIECTLDNCAYFDDASLWCPLDNHCKNILKAEVIEYTKYSNLKCFGHTLSFCIHEMIHKSDEIRSPIVKACCLVTVCRSHTELKKLLMKNMKDPDRLVWNTRKWEHALFALKAIISCDAVELRKVSPSNLSLDDKELEMLHELDYMMHPFFVAVELTQKGMNHTISTIVPTVLALYNHLVDIRQNTPCVREPATDLADALYRHFHGVFANLGMTGAAVENSSSQEFGENLYLLASVLDPTYGLLWLRDVHANETAKSILKKRILDDVLFQIEACACFGNSSDRKSHAISEPPPKAMKMQGDQTNEYFDQAVASSQLKQYLAMVNKGCEGFTCFQFWTKYKSKFHLLYPVACKALAIPATTTAIERVFIDAGIVSKQKQATLDDVASSRLIFLKANANYRFHHSK